MDCIALILRVRNSMKVDRGALSRQRGIPQLCRPPGKKSAMARKRRERIAASRRGRRGPVPAHGQLSLRRLLGLHLWALRLRRRRARRRLISAIRLLLVLAHWPRIVVLAAPKPAKCPSRKPMSSGNESTVSVPATGLADQRVLMTI